MPSVTRPGIEISSPESMQQLPAGASLTVSGLAWGVWHKAKPEFIRSVVVECAGKRVAASLGKPPLPVHPPGPPTVSFTAHLVVPSAPPFSSLEIIARATDSARRTVSTRVSALTVTPGSHLPIRPGYRWTNNTNSLSFKPAFICSPASNSDLLGIVRFAEQSRRKVHAFGTSWSYSDCLETHDFFLQADSLRNPIETVAKALKPQAPPHVVHVQGGMTIKGLYQYLEQKRPQLALETMGGSSGQTIAGAISTGTHGGDIRIGPLADSVLALHIIGAGGTQWWVEPTRGITDPQRLRRFVVPDVKPGNIVYDDATFNACLVSIGCIGIIYAVVLRVRRMYDLVETTVPMSWNGFKASFRQILATPRFAQLAVDPYANWDDPNGCLLTTRVEAPPTKPANRPSVSLSAVVGPLLASMLEIDPLATVDIVFNYLTKIQGLSGADQQTVALVEYILANHPNLRPAITQNYGQFMQAAQPLGAIRGTAHSIMASDYADTTINPWTPSWSMESFFPLTVRHGGLGCALFVEEAVTHIAQTQNTLLAGYVSLRFCGRTRAFLGGQQFSPTCAVEISALQGVQGVEQLVKSLSVLAWNAYRAIPHWGQLIDHGEPSDPTIYPHFKRWRAAFGRLSFHFSERTFENAMSARWGLTTP